MAATGVAEAPPAGAKKGTKKKKTKKGRRKAERSPSAEPAEPAEPVEPEPVPEPVELAPEPAPALMEPEPEPEPVEVQRELASFYEAGSAWDRERREARSETDSMHIVPVPLPAPRKEPEPAAAPAVDPMRDAAALVLANTRDLDPTATEQMVEERTPDALVALLRRPRMEMDGQDDFGWSCLHHAAALGLTEHVEALVDAGPLPKRWHVGRLEQAASSL